MKKTTLKLLCLICITFSYGQTYTSGLFDVENLGASGVRVISAQIDIDVTNDLVTITLIGDDNVWLGLGLNATSMTSGQDVLFFGDPVDNGGPELGTPVVTDRSFIGIGSIPPMDATQNWNVISNTTSGGDRTIIVTRELNTGDSLDYVFPTSPTSMDIVGAHGDLDFSGESTSFRPGYHGFLNKSDKNITFSLLSVDRPNDIQFAMSPNPASSNVNIVLPSHLQKADIQIFDVLGKRIYSGNIKNTHVFNVNVSSWNSGVYLVRITNDSGTLTKRFVKK